MGGLIEPQPAQQDESGRIWTFVGLGVAIVVIVVAVLAMLGRSGRTATFGESISTSASLPFSMV